VGDTFWFRGFVNLNQVMFMKYIHQIVFDGHSVETLFLGALFFDSFDVIISDVHEVAIKLTRENGITQSELHAIV
jgi:hypothetical protein